MFNYGCNCHLFVSVTYGDPNICKFIVVRLRDGFLLRDRRSGPTHL